MQKSKKPRENQKQQKNKKTIFQKSGDRVNRQESWNIVFFVFFVFFGFLEVFWIFAFLLLQESWNIVFFSSFFCFFLVFSRFFGNLEKSKKKAGFWEFCKIEKTLKLCKNPKVSRLCVYPWIFLEFSKNSVVCNLSVSFVLNCSHYHLSIICFHVLIHSVHFLNCSS